MAHKKMRSIKGRAARFTRMDACGAPVYGDCGSVVTKGFTEIAWTENVQEGTEITVTDAWGDSESDKDPSVTKWVDVTITLTDVDLAILDIVGGGTPGELNDDVVAMAFGVSGNLDAFAVEVWTKKMGQGACSSGSTEWGYFVLPFIKNGRFSGTWSVKNDALALVATGQAFLPEGWGTGPYLDNPYMVPAGLPADHMWGLAVSTVQPPSLTDGCVALVEPPDKAAAAPGDVFAAEATVTAQDDTNAAKLDGLGFVADPTSAWAEGEFLTIGTFEFHWTGAAWDDGQAPA